ncbi:putative Kef-type K+ transport protein [Prauserella sediminis]|uniref:Putative Kef-type K+ transport protein n=1 Tax=Prauserella sediminis TaxID=577680 RepID=A0A839XNG8_9PSEU|nr:cation:proton antiporter [Prauserella sediminis]MBB3665392.1 putative Kef-type K+ transport protein [Prauserella sediminis]
METAAIYLVAAFAAGGLALLVKLPPLVGFLVAGFGLQAAGVDHMPGLQTLADLGVTLLLFGIGLKLDVRSLLKARVWLTSLAHMAFSVLLGVAMLLAIAPFGFALLGEADLTEMAIVALALSFSSTVFVVKVLDERRDNQTLYGRIAIGVLIMQDIVAVIVLTVSKGTLPSPWALALVLLVPGVWLAGKAWDRIDSVELGALFGLTMALVPGYVLFDLVGLKGDLGALIIGALLAGHRRAGDLARLLLTGKEVLLIAFFVSIGLTGTPTWEAVGIAALLAVLIPVKSLAFFTLLWLMRLRYRTATLASLALGNYSEFALIVATVVAATGGISEDWVVVLALAVALSFLLSAVLNRLAPGIEAWVTRRLPERDAESLAPDDRPIDLGDADTLVLGMGRVGQAAVQQLHEVHGRRAVGVEHDSGRAGQLRERGFDVVEADATDLDFWARVRRSGRVELILLAMPFHGENLLVLDLLRKKGFTGRVAAIAQRGEELDDLRSRGIDAAFNLYGSAGINLADHAVEQTSAD